MCLGAGLQRIPPSGSAQAIVSSSAASQDAPPRWQDQYADPDWRDKLTRLSPKEEQEFQDWAKESGAPVTNDYDMRGFWKYGGESGVNANDGQLHFTDKYKTPLHESFSGESQYARKDIPGPKWNDKDQLVSPGGTVLFDEPAVVAARKSKEKK